MHVKSLKCELNGTLVGYVNKYDYNYNYSVSYVVSINILRKILYMYIEAEKQACCTSDVKFVVLNTYST